MKVRRIATTGAAALATCAVLGTASPAVQAGTAPAWTQQTPAVHPAAREGAAMAYDAAARTVVLFGGFSGSAPTGHYLGDTWTWNGATWTQQHPAASPRARWEAALAYDAATGNTVLFGGSSQTAYFGDTWTWHGGTWTRQHPAARPGARSSGAAVAYDAATRTVVLFGGNAPTGNLGDTWTWDGRTWARQHPATSPPGRDSATMAYDAATGTAVLFGGFTSLGLGELSDTWTWG